MQFADRGLDAANNGLSGKQALSQRKVFPLLCNGIAYSSLECGGPGSNYFRLTVTTNPKQADTEHQKGRGLRDRSVYRILVTYVQTAGACRFAAPHGMDVKRSVDPFCDRGGLRFGLVWNQAFNSSTNSASESGGRVSRGFHAVRSSGSPE